MPQVYNLDLQTMLSTLSRRQFSGSLTADIPKGRVGRESAHIEINVDSGKIISCVLKSGLTYITGENVLQIIAQLDVIPWTFMASPSQSTVAPATELVSQAHIPKRSMTLQSAELAKLPRTHFHVYAYIDGKRTVEELAHLLRTTNEQIERVLFDLRTWKIVQEQLSKERQKDSL